MFDIKIENKRSRLSKTILSYFQSWFFKLDNLPYIEEIRLIETEEKNASELKKKAREIDKKWNDVNSKQNITQAISNSFSPNFTPFIFNLQLTE